MDPRIKDLAFGAALNAIVRSAGMGPTGMDTGTGSIGDQLRRIGTLPPPSSATTITTSPEEPTVQTTAPVSAGGDGGYEPMPGGGAGGGGITFGNPQTPFLDRQGVPMTVADLAGRGVDILSFMSNPLICRRSHADLRNDGPTSQGGFDSSLDRHARNIHGRNRHTIRSATRNYAFSSVGDLGGRFIF